MSYKVEWYKNAYKYLEKLPSNILTRILNKFDIMKEDPFRFLEHYGGKNVYKFRIGDYRALIDVDFGNKILYVRVFDKRGRIYK